MSEASAAIHAEFAPGATTIQMMLRIGTPVFGDDAAVSHAGRMTAQGAAGGRRSQSSAPPPTVTSIGFASVVDRTTEIALAIISTSIEAAPVPAA